MTNQQEKQSSSTDIINQHIDILQKKILLSLHSDPNFQINSSLLHESNDTTMGTHDMTNNDEKIEKINQILAHLEHRLDTEQVAHCEQRSSNAVSPVNLMLFFDNESNEDRPSLIRFDSFDSIKLYRRKFVKHEGEEWFLLDAADIVNTSAYIISTLANVNINPLINFNI